MIWYLLLVVIMGFSSYFAIKAFYVRFSKDNPFEWMRFGFDSASILFIIGSITRIAAQVNVILILIPQVLQQYKAGLLFFQIIFTIIAAFVEFFGVYDYLKCTKDTYRKVDGKYDVKIDKSGKKIEVSEHYEGHGEIPWQNLLAMPFRLLYTFFIPICSLIFKWVLYKRKKSKKEEERRLALEKIKQKYNSKK